MTGKNNINVLMTGGGAPGAAGILNCLGREKSFHVTVVDANSNAVGKYLVADFETIPLAADPSFIGAMLEICSRKKINVLLPLVTKELSLLAEHLSHFEKEGVRVLMSPVASLEIANNKSKLYEFLQWRGIPVPAFRIVGTVEQFKTAVTELGYSSQPVCFKPSVSNGSRGFRIISEQMNELDLLFNHKPASTYIRPEDAFRILSSGKFPELLVSEYLPGEEYSVDCLANRGDAVLIIPRIRRRIINGISVEGEFVKEENIIRYCSQIIKELHLHGNIGIQVKKAADGRFLILEINPRVQGATSAALGAGINLPVLALKQELGVSISPEETKVKWGTRFTRYWNEVFY
jgi:carbamoyl-phosphate synthase large subunit